MKLKFFCLVLVASTLLIVELAARLLFATQVGPRILLYGTRWHRSEQVLSFSTPGKSLQIHRNFVGDYGVYRPDKSGSYAKYFPYEKKFTAAPNETERYPVRINRHGFRGVDFEIEKTPGTLRVLTLGASSTLGYHNRDTETYPYVLERILNEEAGLRRRFEVINFAIAHAITDNILSMFLAEGLALDPDFVTLYAGVNDSAVVEEYGGAGRLWLALREASVVMELANYGLSRVAEPASVYWSEEYAEHRSQVFLENVQTLMEECQRRNIVLIVASQQATALWTQRDLRRGLSYRDEVTLVRERVARGVEPDGQPKKEVPRSLSLIEGSIEGEAERLKMALDPARVLLVHSRLMQELERWVATTDIDYVDVIDLLDEDRDLLLTWVHLAPKANRMVARAFADVILQHHRQANPG